MSRLNRGFTLIEILVSVAILGIISAIAIPAYNGYTQNSYLTECTKEVSLIALAQSEYFIENNAYFPEPVGTTTSGVGPLEAASRNIYISSYTVPNNPGATMANLADANCTYSVTTAVGPSYTITATGTNKLTASETFTKTN